MFKLLFWDLCLSVYKRLCLKERKKIDETGVEIWSILLLYSLIPWALQVIWSGCLADISAWMKEHHLQLNLTKTELLIFPATPTLQHDFTIQIDSATITPSSSVKNLGVNFQWPADFQRPHCKNCSILQICTTQHQKDHALPYTVCSTTSCPGPCHF